MAQLWQEVMRKRSRESDNYLFALRQKYARKKVNVVYSKDSGIVTKCYFNHFAVTFTVEQSRQQGQLILFLQAIWCVSREFQICRLIFWKDEFQNCLHCCVQTISDNSQLLSFEKKKSFKKQNSQHSQFKCIRII